MMNANFINLRLFIFLLNLFAFNILFVGCFQTSPDVNSSGTTTSSVDVVNEAKDLNQILQEFRGGTVDVRQELRIQITGEYSEDKLMKTQITVKGNGKEILLSNQAIAIVKHGVGDFSLSNFKNYNYFVITESFGGEKIQTVVNSDKMHSYNYKLRL